MCRMQVSFSFRRQKAYVTSQRYFVTIHVRLLQLFLYIHNLQIKTAHVRTLKAIRNLCYSWVRLVIILFRMVISLYLRQKCEVKTCIVVTYTWWENSQILCYEENAEPDWDSFSLVDEFAWLTEKMMINMIMMMAVIVYVLNWLPHTVGSNEMVLRALKFWTLSRQIVPFTLRPIYRRENRPRCPIR
jgi:hypothetical protein